MELIKYIWWGLVILVAIIALTTKNENQGW